MTSEADNLDDGRETSPPRKRRRPRLVVVIGLWVLCFPSFVGSAILAADILLNYRTSSNFLIFWVTFGTLLLTASILYYITRNYFTLPEATRDLSADFTDYAEQERVKEGAQERHSGSEEDLF